MSLQASVSRGDALAGPRCMLPHMFTGKGSPGRDLDSARLRAWEVVRDASAQVVRSLSRDLEETAGIPLEWYSVITRLTEAGGTLPQNELLRRSRFSQSGVSRLAKRMEEEGLVERRPSERDRRNLDVVLTEHGQDVYFRVLSVHHSSVQKHFGMRLTDEEAAALTTLMRKVLDEPGAEEAEETAAENLEQFLPFGETVLAVTSESTSLRDISATREALELPLLLDAARHARPSVLNDLRARVLSMSRLIDEPEEFFRAGWELHRQIASCCQNDVLRTLYLNLLDAIASHVKRVVPTHNLRQYLYERLAVHARIVDAVASGEPELIEAAARAHDYIPSRLYEAMAYADDRVALDS
ncbi:FCD domain-containing protein [Streptomyces iakyrus]|uniref:FCD domain-containing protein n=1 Tax=Streptomyces iakyrus TaxID=68219 RepID=A0ABW8FKL5_9ACTN